jgi:hypothetical protein
MDSNVRKFGERMTLPESAGDIPREQVRPNGTTRDLHPAWIAFLDFCGKLQYGEIACLRIQDSLPFLAEVTKKKVKFT